MSPITELSNLQNETVVNTSPSTESTDSNGKRRDITKNPPGSRQGYMYSKLCSMLALLWTETEGTKIPMSSQLVADSLDQHRELAKHLSAGLMVEMARGHEDVSTEEAVKKKWSTVSEDLQQKYVVMLEEKALKEYKLDIGRCVDS